METDYWNALDQRKIAEKIRVEPSRLGVSAHPMKEPLSELKAKSFWGATRVEIGFAGKEKGAIGKGAFSPEMIGKTARESMRELAKINEIELSTHATIAVGGFSGLTDRGFKEEEREKALFEIKRTVDFAADTAQGGPIVVHTGEFPRPVYREGEKFRAYEKEEEKRIHYLVDEHTGAMIKDVKEDEVIFEPIPMKDEKGNIVPQRTPDGKIKLDEYKNPIPEYKLDEHGDIKVEQVKFSDFKEKLPESQKKDAALIFFKKQQLAEKEYHGGQAEQYEMAYKRGIEKKKHLENAYEKYKETPATIKEIKAQQLGVPRGENPDKFFKDQIREAEKEMAYGREIAVSSRKQAEQKGELIRRARPLENFAIQKSAENLARAGLYAYDVEKKRGLKKPLFIAPENMFPESYGSHPQELRTLVVKSRQAMAKRLQTKGHSKQEAKKIAADHIKATFDIGHANIWKKYFQGDEKEFNSWLKAQVSQLTKEGIIGHVHISDNFGYYDEHLAPGEGSVPIKEFAEELEKQGYKGPMIVEAGAQAEGTEYETLTGAFKTLNSPIYRVDGLSQTWSDIQTSYFARTSGTPGYLVGDYVPSKDWTLWSETPLE